jgi:hypothetical protein
MTIAEALAAIRLRTVVISTLDGKQIVGVPEATLRHLGFLADVAIRVGNPGPSAAQAAPRLMLEPEADTTMDAAHQAWIEELGELL